MDSFGVVGLFGETGQTFQLAVLRLQVLKQRIVPSLSREILSS